MVEKYYSPTTVALCVGARIEIFGVCLATSLPVSPFVWGRGLK